MAGAYVRNFSSGLHGLCMHVASSFGWEVDDLMPLGQLMQVICIIETAEAALVRRGFFLARL